MLCYLLIDNFIGVCPGLARVNVYHVVEKDVRSFSLKNGCLVL